jgi:outer membrane protein OmpA-like peptidoglycan-associated protein
MNNESRLAHQVHSIGVMSHKTLTILGPLFLALGCGTAVEQESVPPTRTGGAVSVVPERSAPPVYYETTTGIDPIVARRLDMQMATQAAVGREQHALVEPTLGEACGWKKPAVYFGAGDAKLGLANDATVKSIAVCLRSQPLADKRVVLVGHADARGSTYDNLELGLERANEVKQALVETGVSPDRIETYSRGEYVVDADEQLHDDRRVVVKLDR